MLKSGCLSFVRGSMRNFSKPALTAEEQIKLLIDRGLIISDKMSAIDILKRISYYHLSAYTRVYQRGINHEFIPDTSFRDVIDLYNFDEELRLISFNAVRKIETAYKAALSNIMCEPINNFV